LTDSGYPQQYADGIAGYIVQQLGSGDLDKGDVLRIGIIQKVEQAKIIRASVYRGTRNLVTVAVDDKGRYVPGSEPP
ncbi:M23 family peptidase, partial [Rhizobium ruizarguesonis]